MGRYVVVGKDLATRFIDSVGGKVSSGSILPQKQSSRT